jgi:hypothetical protein
MCVCLIEILRMNIAAEDSSIYYSMPTELKTVNRLH